MKFYVTTPIYYPNSKPHLGSAFTTIVADVLARYYRMKGYSTLFVTGLDEHGTKIAKKAEQNNLSPKEFVDLQAKDYKNAWSLLNISYDRFIRTTDKDHEETVKKILSKMYENGDIYKGKYSGYYCVDCEAYYINETYCPIHNKKLEYMEIDSYFFKLSKYQNYIESIIDSLVNLPYRNELKERLSSGLKDISISRPKSQLSWGIELPFDNDHVAYVWVDALINYLSASGYGTKQFDIYWPADVHLVGKEISWFHSVIWPAMLKSVAIKPPKKVLVHGFITVDGKKMSKSLGNVVDPIDLVNKYGSDAVRFYLIKKASFSSDFDFSMEEFKEIYRKQLIGDYGNLVNRLFVLISKFGLKEDDHFSELVNEKLSLYEKLFNNYELTKALDVALSLASLANSYLSEKEPWKNKDEADKILFNSLYLLHASTILLYPFIPSSTNVVLKRLNSSPFLSEVGNVSTDIDHSRLILFKNIE